MKQKGQVLIIGIIIGMLIAGGLFGAYYFGTLKNSKPQTANSVTNPENQQTTSTPVPTQTPDETDNWKPLSLNKLTYKIPSTWWSYKPEGQTKTISIFVNPTPLPIPGDYKPAFNIIWEGKKTISQKKDELLASWELSDIKEESVTIAGNKSTVLTGMTSPGMFDSFKLTAVLIPNSEELYLVLDYTSIDDHEKYLNQILSTFKFTN